MPKSDVAKTSSGGPLKTVVNALEMAVKAAKDGTADAKTTAGKYMDVTMVLRLRMRWLSR
jgi:hypothetical protein